MVWGIPFAIYRNGSFEFIFKHYLNAVIFMVLFYNLVDSHKKLQDILFVACLSVLLYFVFSLKNGTFRYGRMYFGGNFDPNDLAYFANSFLILNLTLISIGQRKIIRITGILNVLLSTFVVLLTASRGGFISLIVIATLFFTTKNEIFKRSKKIIITALAVLLALTQVDQLNIERLMSIKNIDQDYNVTDEFGRMSIWRSGIRMMAENPLTGVGANNFGEALGKQRANKGVLPQWQNAHNSFVQIGAEMGVIGLILYILLSFKGLAIFRKVWKESHSSSNQDNRAIHFYILCR